MKKYIIKEYEKQLEFLLEEYLKVKNKKHRFFKTVKDLAHHYNVSPKHLRDLYNRKKETKSVLPRKRGPKKPWNKPPKELERIVVFIKRKTTLSNLRISRILLKKGYSVSEKGIGNILKRYPMPPVKKKKVKRYEKKNPGELGHIDVHKVKNIKGKDPKDKYYLAALEDDCTRLTYVERIPDKKAETLEYFLERGLNWFAAEYMIFFEALLSDNGKEFTTHFKKGKEEHCFEKYLKREDISHKYTRPYRPQTNGKVEAFWKIIKKEFLSKKLFHEWNGFDNSLSEYMNYYNTKREHGGIKYLIPEEKLISLDSDFLDQIITELRA